MRRLMEQYNDLGCEHFPFYLHESKILKYITLVELYYTSDVKKIASESFSAKVKLWYCAKIIIQQ